MEKISLKEGYPTFLQILNIVYLRALVQPSTEHRQVHSGSVRSRKISLKLDRLHSFFAASTNESAVQKEEALETDFPGFLVDS